MGVGAKRENRLNPNPVIPRDLIVRQPRLDQDWPPDDPLEGGAYAQNFHEVIIFTT